MTQEEGLMLILTIFLGTSGSEEYTMNLLKHEYDPIAVAREGTF